MWSIFLALWRWWFRGPYRHIYLFDLSCGACFLLLAYGNVLRTGTTIMLTKFETKSNRVKGLSFHPKRWAEVLHQAQQATISTNRGGTESRQPT